MNGAFSPDDRLFATASMHGMVRIWDVESGSLFAVIRGHSGMVEHVEFSPDGSRLLTASHDGTARLWDIDGVLTTTLRHRHPPTFAVFSPDGTRVVTGGGDTVGHVWDVASGREIADAQDTAGVRSSTRRSALMAVVVATASSDGRILLWDAESGREIARLEGHRSSVVHVRFSPERRPSGVRVSRWNGAAVGYLDRRRGGRPEGRRDFAESPVQPGWTTWSLRR